MTKIEVTDSDKHSSISRIGINYVRKTFLYKLHVTTFQIKHIYGIQTNTLRLFQI